MLEYGWALRSRGVKLEGEPEQRTLYSIISKEGRSTEYGVQSIPGEPTVDDNVHTP